MVVGIYPKLSRAPSIFQDGVMSTSSQFSTSFYAVSFTFRYFSSIQFTSRVVILFTAI